MGIKEARYFFRYKFKQALSLKSEIAAKAREQVLKNTIPGIFAVGDNCSPMRSLSAAIASGTLAGTFINHELIDEDF